MVCFVRFYSLKVTIYIVMLNTCSLLTSSDDVLLEEIKHLCFLTAKLTTVRRFYGIHYHLWIQLVLFLCGKYVFNISAIPPQEIRQRHTIKATEKLLQFFNTLLNHNVCNALIHHLSFRCRCYCCKRNTILYH